MKEEISDFADRIEKITNESWERKVNFLIYKIKRSNEPFYSKELIIKLLNILKDEDEEEK